MATKLSKEASGTRQVRWAREILAAIKAQLKLNSQLTDVQKQALLAEQVIVSTLTNNLIVVVLPYREYLDTAFIDVRAEQRVGDYLCDIELRGADGSLRHLKEEIAKHLPGGFSTIMSNLVLSRLLSSGRRRTVELVRHAALMIASLPPSIGPAQTLAESLNKAADVLESANKHRTEVVDTQRKPLRLNVERAIMDLHEGLEQMDGRLRTHFTSRFIDSLYPELAKNRTKVVDLDDDDDDVDGVADSQD